MDSKSRAVLDAALGLSEADRAVIAEALLGTLSPDGAGVLAEDEFANELERRFEEASNDPESTIPWSELKDEH